MLSARLTTCKSFQSELTQLFNVQDLNSSPTNTLAYLNLIVMQTYLYKHESIHSIENATPLSCGQTSCKSATPFSDTSHK